MPVSEPRSLATVLNFCEIIAQRYVAAPDHSPDTAIYAGDVERHIRLGARLSRSTSACWPDLTSFAHTHDDYAGAPAKLPGLFCAVDRWLNLRDLCSSQIAKV
jgi:hypothetical protein